MILSSLLIIPHVRAALDSLDQAEAALDHLDSSCREPATAITMSRIQEAREQLVELLARLEQDTPDASAQLDVALTVEGMEFVGELRRSRPVKEAK